MKVKYTAANWGQTNEEKRVGTVVKFLMGIQNIVYAVVQYDNKLDAVPISLLEVIDE